MEDSSVIAVKGVSSSPVLCCRVQPVVILNILDHFIRRNDGANAIGTLLGIISEGVVEIKNCFPVPHNDTEQVAVDQEFLHNMLDLHHKVNPKENIVGWYSTVSAITDSTVIFHEFFGKETATTTVAGAVTYPPIHLNVDTNLSNCTLSVKACMSTTVILGERQFGNQFLPLPVEIQTNDTEKIAVDILRKGSLSVSGKAAPLVSELQGLESSLKKLLEMLDKISEYVNSVLSDKKPGDNAVGRFLIDAVSALPKLEASTLEKMFDNNLQDLLLVVYLANLTRTQLQLSDKLQKVVDVV